MYFYETVFSYLTQKKQFEINIEKNMLLVKKY